MTERTPRDGVGPLEAIIAASDDIARVEGRPDGPYLYTSQPGDGQVRIVFRDRVCRSYTEALIYVAYLRVQAAGYRDAPGAGR